MVKYLCKDCNIVFVGHRLEYCPYCGEKLKFIGIVLGMSEDKSEKAKCIYFWIR